MSYLLLLVTHIIPSALSLICNLLWSRFVAEVEAHYRSRRLLEQEERGQGLLRRVGILGLLFAHLTRLARRVHNGKGAHQGVESIGVNAGILTMDHAVGLVHESLIEILNITHDCGKAGKDLVLDKLAICISHHRTRSVQSLRHESPLLPPNRKCGNVAEAVCCMMRIGLSTTIGRQM